jgi:hypothetical protein
MSLRTISTILLLLGLLLLPGVVVAAGTPTIGWYVIGGGGGHADAGIYALDGTIGQPVVGLSSNAQYGLCAGFWCWVWAQYRIDLPIIMR